MSKPVQTCSNMSRLVHTALESHFRSVVYPLFTICLPFVYSFLPFKALSVSHHSHFRSIQPWKVIFGQLFTLCLPFAYHLFSLVYIDLNDRHPIPFPALSFHHEEVILTLFTLCLPFAYPLFALAYPFRNTYIHRC